MARRAASAPAWRHGQRQPAGRSVCRAGAASHLTGSRGPDAPLMAQAPGILARGPWSADQVTARWHDEAFVPDAAATAAADAAVAALAARGSPSHDGLAATARRPRAVGPDGALVLDLQPARWALRLSTATPAARSRRCAWCATATGAGSPAGALPGWPRGRAAGRSAPAAPSTSSRTRSTRWCASCARSGRSSPSACSGEALVLLPHQHGDVHRPGLARPGRRGDARPRARRARLVAGRRRRPGRSRPTSRCGGWRRCWRALRREPLAAGAQAPVVPALGRSTSAC